MKLKLLLIGSLFFLVACKGQQIKPVPEPVVIVKTVALDCGDPPQRPTIDFKPITWKVSDDLFTLTAAGYEDLSYNMTEIWAGIENLQLIISYYERCLEPK